MQEGKEGLAKILTTSSTGSHCFARSLFSFMFILCLVAKNEPRKHAKGIPLGTPRRVFAGVAFASQHDAKGCIFRFCVGVLNKNTDTEDARDKRKKKFLLSATRLIST